MKIELISFDASCLGEFLLNRREKLFNGAKIADFEPVKGGKR